MSFWLKYSVDPNYSVPQISHYPSGIWAKQVVSSLLPAWILDTVLRGRHWRPLLAVAIWHAIDTATLAGLPVYSSNQVPRWVFYYLSGVVNCTPGLLYSCQSVQP